MSEDMSGEFIMAAIAKLVRYKVTCDPSEVYLGRHCYNHIWGPSLQAHGVVTGEEIGRFIECLNELKAVYGFKVVNDQDNY